MSAATGSRLSGRQAQAARNNELILEAARAVFLANPEAPVSAVAERAGVGMAALYRRYASKEDLLRKLCLDGLRAYIAAATAALDDDQDPWTAFAGFMRAVVEAGSGSLTVRLAGTFTPTEELYREAGHAQDLTVRLFERVRAAGAIRPDLEVHDISLIFEQLAAVRVRSEERTHALRERYLTLLLDAISAEPATPLPGPGPTWAELGERWVTGDTQA